LLDQFVNLVLSVTKISALDEVLELSLLEAAVGAVELERPQEVRRLLEVGADCENFVDHVLHADHAVLAKILFNDLVVSQRQTLLVDLAISTFCLKLALIFTFVWWTTYCR
jgi:hypothetical protein